MSQAFIPSIETRTSWAVTAVALVVMAIAFGGPWIATVALKEIAAEAGGARSVPSLAAALAWFGTGLGGILMGWVSDRIGMRTTAVFGGVMIAVGLALATLGPGWQLYLGYGLFIGVLGLGSINAPLYIYVSRWFDRHRGSALALISSGGYLAGTLWPPIFQKLIAYAGWRQTMLCYAAFAITAIVPLSAIVLRRPPEQPHYEPSMNEAAPVRSVLGWPPNLVFAMMAAAAFMCCVTMSMPQGHLVAFCSDIGIAPSHGAMMLSLLLGSAFVSRQVWGAISDRIGGLNTVLLGSACQALTLSGFLLTQDEYGLFAISAAFGLGFAGLIPAYVLALRELYPVSQAYWRIPGLLLCSGTGMGLGNWIAGVIYDHFGYYAPSFATGIAFNVLNFIVVGTLVLRQWNIRQRSRLASA
jgi:MFS family permease